MGILQLVEPCVRWLVRLSYLSGLNASRMYLKEVPKVAGVELR